MLQSYQINLCFAIGYPGASQVVLLVKNRPACSEDIRDMGLIPGSGRSPGGRLGNPLQYSCLENSMDIYRQKPNIEKHVYLFKSQAFLKHKYEIELFVHVKYLVNIVLSLRISMFQIWISMQLFSSRKLQIFYNAFKSKSTAQKCHRSQGRYTHIQEPDEGGIVNQIKISGSIFAGFDRMFCAKITFLRLWLC